MNKFVIFSDFHAHNFKDFSTRLSSGRNSRFQDQLNVLAELREYCILNGIEKVFFLGDLFHARKSVDVDVLNGVYTELEAFAQANITITAIVGNHDQYLKSDLSIVSTRPFSDVMFVVDKPSMESWTCNAGVNVVFALCPYGFEPALATRGISNYANYYKVFMGHLGVQGARIGSSLYMPDEEITLPDLRTSEFDAVYLGHYHARQRIAPNTLFVGNPLQQNWSDSGQQKGWTVAGFGANGLEETFVPASGPKFVIVDKDTWTPEIVKGNFVRLVGQSLSQALRKKIMAAEPRGFEVVEIPKQATIEEIERVNQNLTVSEVITDYIVGAKTSLNKRKLLCIIGSITEEMGG